MFEIEQYVEYPTVRGESASLPTAQLYEPVYLEYSFCDIKVYRGPLPFGKAGSEIHILGAATSS